MEEKRKFGRISFGSPIGVVLESESWVGTLHDLSMKGAQIEFVEPPPLETGARCLVRLTLGADLILEFQAEAAHVHERVLGVKFILTDVDSFTHLHRLMELNTGGDEQLDRELLA